MSRDTGRAGREAPRQRADALERIDTLLSLLSRLVLDAADLDRIAAEITRILDDWNVVASPDGRERGASLTDEQRALLEQGDLVDPTGRVKVERLRSPAGSGGGSLGEGEVRLVKIAAAGSDLVRLICVSPE